MLKNPDLKYVKFEYTPTCDAQMKAVFGKRYSGMSSERHPKAIPLAHFYDNGFMRTAVRGQYVIDLPLQIDIVSEAEFKTKYCKDETPKPIFGSCVRKDSMASYIRLSEPLESVLTFINSRHRYEGATSASVTYDVSADWSISLSHRLGNNKYSFTLVPSTTVLLFEGNMFHTLESEEFERRYNYAT